MKTSTLTLRPHVPGALGTDREDELIKSPVAKIIYGGVTIELDSMDVYRLICNLNKAVDHDSIDAKEMGIIIQGLEEIQTEMNMDLDHHDEVPSVVWFRDNPVKCSLRHPYGAINLNIITSDDKRLIEWDQALKEHPDTKWKTPWGEETP